MLYSVRIKSETTVEKFQLDCSKTKNLFMPDKPGNGKQRDHGSVKRTEGDLRLNANKGQSERKNFIMWMGCFVARSRQMVFCSTLLWFVANNGRSKRRLFDCFVTILLRWSQIVGLWLYNNKSGTWKVVELQAQRKIGICWDLCMNV